MLFQRNHFGINFTPLSVAIKLSRRDIR